MIKKDIKSMTLKQLAEYIENINEPKYRSQQIFAAIHKKKMQTSMK